VADAAVFPSLYEPFGIVALEAMAARCPVVVSEVGGLKEVVQCCEGGLTVQPGNPDSVAWGIVRALTEEDEARELAEAGYRKVCEEYNWDHIAALTIAAYARAQPGRGL
jgi:glycogen(starch) synthase